jgi:uncharacterized spore protein YtfJ
MNEIINIFQTLSERMKQIAKGNAVVAKTISVGDRHVIPLCELSLSCGGFGGSGSENVPDSKEPQVGTGGGMGGGAKAQPVAVIIIENGKAHIESLR